MTTWSSLIDQDGIQTLVEINRSSDTHIRRKVVGQMLIFSAKMRRLKLVDIRYVPDKRSKTLGKRFGIHRKNPWSEPYTVCQEARCGTIYLV